KRSLVIDSRLRSIPYGISFEVLLAYCQGNDQGLGANEGVEGVNGNVEGANEGAPDFSMIIAQQLQNLLPSMLALVSNQGKVGNQNGNVVNENVQRTLGM
ncbi:hypothetical protein Tco_0293528, partial [Tanacetum coccineum]